MAGKKKRKRYKIPNDLSDIESKPYTPPSRETVEKDIAELKADFEKHKYAEYIDVYNDNHAMFKFEYYFDKYLDSDLKRRCKKWCNDFNYANTALQKIKEIRSYEVY
jgi:hypothetical protein